MQKAALCSALLIVCGCGGGGGGNDQSFAGVYVGRLVVTENTCEFKLAPMDRTYTVNQDGQKVVLDSSGGSVYEGTVTDNTSFIVSNTGSDNCVNTQTGQVIPTSTYQFTDTISFEFKDGNSAQVTFMEQEGNCTGNSFINNASCHYTLLGTFERKQ